MGSPKRPPTTPLAEDELVESIRGVVGTGSETFGLRDDAALLDVPAGRSLVASVDSVVDGIHVDRSVCSPGDVGWKALMRALSDLAAMGAAPLGALVALCVPSPPGGGRDGTLAVEVMRGVAEAAGASGCPVAGGDVSGASELVVAVTVLGTVDDGAPPVPRSGGRPGDVLVITGPCGGSAAGLRRLRSGGDGAGAAYCRPVARLREGQLARRCATHAMIDVSDGLAIDVHRLADAAGLGFRLDSVPVADGATEEEALGGGEDYELVLAAGAEDVAGLMEAFDAQRLRRPVVLGVLVEDPGARTLRGAALARLGWQHTLG